jgi:[ribosomal protein S18]-alanine N-acetyltransferase
MNNGEGIDIHKANEQEKDLAAGLLSGSEPWITLGITLDQCYRNCHDPEFLVFIAYLKNEPGGIIIIDPRGIAGSPYVKSIAVFPEFRGQGIGKRLLLFAEELFRKESKHIFICVSSFNLQARKLYEKCGFEAVGEFKDYIINGASEILMHKRL